MLVSGNVIDNGFFSEAYNRHYPIDVPDSMVESVLPELLATGRLFLTREPDERQSHGNEDEPLKDCLNELWTLVLSLEKNKDDYMLNAYLVNGDKRVNSSETIAIMKSGFVVWRDRITRTEHTDNCRLLPVLLDLAYVPIKATHVDKWLQNFYRLKRMPQLEVPNSIAFDEYHCEPIPILRITKNDPEYNSGDFLYGLLSFRYQDQEVSWIDDGDVILYGDEQKIIRRNKAKEDEFILDIADAGFRHKRIVTEEYMMSFRKTDVWGCPSDYMEAAASLNARGWDVYIESSKIERGSINVSVSYDIDWFDVKINADFPDETVDFPRLLQDITINNGFIKLKDGTMGVLSQADIDKLRVLLRIGRKQDNKLQFSIPQAFLLDTLLSSTPGINWNKKAAETRKQLHSLSPKPHPPVNSFAGTLRDYQKDGLGWLHYLNELQLGGCLADDMGLGKTIQTLALLLERKKNIETNYASLVVVPKSLMFNWRNEAERFTPELKLHTYHGTDRERSVESFDDFDLIISTYGTVRQDIAILKDYTFDYVILDEAQAIKNSKTAVSKSVRILSSNHRLAISGTPIENHLGELWSLFEFLNPGMLGTGSWLRDTKARKYLSQSTCELISKAVRPFILRRTKEQVAEELPPKTEETIFCDMTPKQSKLYNELRDHYRSILAGKNISKSKIMVLEALLRLRQTACHPGLVKDEYKHQHSGKIDTAMQLINDIVQSGHKVLVFSQFTKLLGLVKPNLESEKIKYSYLDGKTRKREEKINDFQNDPACSVFLISLKAGGLGLNLTAADYVILLDPWWNPAVEAQAIDRAHRIGQKRHVFAYRIVTKDSVEEKILELQQKKRDLADAIITRANSLISRLTTEDLNTLLS